MKEDAIHHHMPDYSVSLENDIVVFHNRNTVAIEAKSDSDFPQLTPNTYDDARVAAPGYDVYALEQQWLNWWCESGKPELQNPDKAFIGFCKRRYEMNPNP